MKKTKLLTSLAAFVLVLGLGACNGGSSDDTSVDDGGSSDSTTSEKVTLSNYTLSIGITYNGELEAVPDYATAYIEGGWDNWAGFVALTPAEDGRYDYTFASIAPGSYEYQLVLAYEGEEPGWTYRITQDGANAKFTVSATDGDGYRNEVTVEALSAVSDIIPDPSSFKRNVKVKFDIVSGEESLGILSYASLRITGSFDNWNEWFECSVDEDGYYYYVFDTLSPIEYEYNACLYYTGETLSGGYYSYKVNGSNQKLAISAELDAEGATVEAKVEFDTQDGERSSLEDVLPQPSGDTESGEGGDDEKLLGSFDFTNNGADSGTVISSNDALDEFWTGEEGLYIEARQHSTVYLGNGSGGAYDGSKTCIKFGASGTDGYLQLKFAVGITIDKVVVSACSWTSGETDQLKINGISQDTSSTGEAAELTYEFEDAYNYLLDFEPTGRVTIHAIDIYGTYTPEDVAPITALTLTPSTTEAINVGESLDVAVSYEPTNTVFDPDTLTWASDAENVATAEVSLTGGKVNGIGSGEATITATAENGVSASFKVIVEDSLESSETFTIDGLGYSGTNEDSVTLTGHQSNMTVATGTGSTSPRWDSNLVRVYANNTITFTPTYEDKGATISKIEIVCNGTYYGNDAAEFTDANGESAGTIDNPKTSGCTITINVTATGAVTLTEWVEETHTTTSGGTQLRFTSVTVYYNIAA